jgi:hypothetical protein
MSGRPCLWEFIVEILWSVLGVGVALGALAVLAVFAVVKLLRWLWRSVATVQSAETSGLFQPSRAFRAPWRAAGAGGALQAQAGWLPGAAASAARLASAAPLAVGRAARAAARLILAAPGSGEALARAAPARAARALRVRLPALLATHAPATMPVSWADAAWLAVIAAAACSAALSLLSLAWRAPAVRAAAPWLRVAATQLLSAAVIAAATAEAADAALHAASTGLWCVGAARCSAAVGAGAAAARGAHPALRPHVSPLLRALPRAAFAALCAAASAQVLQLGAAPAAGLTPGEASRCATALACAAAELSCGAFSLGSPSAYAWRGATLLADDVRALAAHPPPVALRRAARGAARAAFPAATAASAALFASAAASPQQHALHRAALAAAAATQALVAAIMAGAALQRSTSPALQTGGARLEASASRLYTRLDLGAARVLRCLAARLLPRLRRGGAALLRAAHAGVRGVLELALRSAARLLRPLLRVWRAPSASLLASLAVLAAALGCRAYAPQLALALGGSATAAAAAMRAAAAAAAAAASAPATALRAALPPPLRAACSRARAAAAAADASLALGAHTSPRFALGVLSLHAGQASLLRLMLTPQDAPATRLALAAFFARAAGRALLLPLVACRAGAALGMRADGVAAGAARAATPLAWALLASALAVEGAQRVQLGPLRAARAAAAERREGPVRVDGTDACVICLDELSPPHADADAATAVPPQPVLALACGHAFHSGCITAWLAAAPAQERRCPTCRAPASGGDAASVAWRDVMFE